MARPAQAKRVSAVLLTVIGRAHSSLAREESWRAMLTRRNDPFLLEVVRIRLHVPCLCEQNTSEQLADTFECRRIDTAGALLPPPQQCSTWQLSVASYLKLGEFKLQYIHSYCTLCTACAKRKSAEMQKRACITLFIVLPREFVIPSIFTDCACPSTSLQRLLLIDVVVCPRLPGKYQHSCFSPTVLIHYAMMRTSPGKTW